VDDERFLRATLPQLDMVHNLARRLMRSRQDAEDLVQETYLNALRGWRRREPDDIGPWLATICLNAARSTFRARTARPAEVLDGEAGLDRVSGSDTADEAMDRLAADAVHDALLRLPETQRVAITLTDLCGFTAAEAAAILGVPRGTVLSRMHRGHKALAALVGGEVRDREA
jgi:RNA polymerase sigma-70 factor (ECF subfamily)